MSADAPHVDCCEMAVDTVPANKRVFMVVMVRVQESKGCLWPTASSCEGRCTAGPGKTLR